MFVVLRERIVMGAYPAGSMIPREEDLCTYFAVSRMTKIGLTLPFHCEGV